MALEDFDTIDRKILAHLDVDAWISYSELGKKIRVAKETVKYRINQLQENGIIKGFYTLINISKLGYNIYRLYLELQNTSPTTEKKIIDYLVNSKYVFICYHINGPFDIAMAIIAKNRWEFELFWVDLKKNFGQYFSDSHFSMMTYYAEFSRPYLYDQPVDYQPKRSFTTVEPAKSEKFTDIDLKLLSFISNNARTSLVSIANALNISVVTVKYRMKILGKNNVIVGFRPILDLQKIGVEYYKVDLWLRKFDRMGEISRYILSHSEVAYQDITLVSGDLEFDIETKNFESFTNIMNSFKEKFPKDIKNYSYYSLVKNYKTSYAPQF